MPNLQWGLMPAQLLHLEVNPLKGRAVLAKAYIPHHRNLTKTQNGLKTHCFLTSHSKGQLHPKLQRTGRTQGKHNTVQHTQINRENYFRKPLAHRRQHLTQQIMAYNTHRHLCIKQNKATQRSTSKRKTTTKTHMLHPFIHRDRQTQSPADTQNPHRDWQRLTVTHRGRHRIILSFPY